MTPREIREQRRLFKVLGMNVISFLAQLDCVIIEPPSPDRGRKIARLCSDLELANDSAMRFGLGLERKGVKLSKVKRPGDVRQQKPQDTEQ